jgi:branched-chain amino acid transport system permease protein
MRGFAPILIVVALLAAMPMITSSNVVLNFLVVALLIALVGQGWNVLGGYGGQYSFGHAAFFGTGAYATAILRRATASTPGSASSLASPRAPWSEP